MDESLLLFFQCFLVDKLVAVRFGSISIDTSITWFFKTPIKNVAVGCYFFYSPVPHTVCILIYNLISRMLILGFIGKPEKLQQVSRSSIHDFFGLLISLHQLVFIIFLKLCSIFLFGNESPGARQSRQFIFQKSSFPRPPTKPQKNVINGVNKKLHQKDELLSRFHWKQGKVSSFISNLNAFRSSCWVSRRLNFSPIAEEKV
jgi:hypothetical protein